MLQLFETEKASIASAGHEIFAHFAAFSRGKSKDCLVWTRDGTRYFRILTTCVLITGGKMVHCAKRDQNERSNETQNATKLREVMERSKMVNAQHLFALY